MTRATYNTDSTLTELPGMERPRRPFAANYDNQSAFNLDLTDYQMDMIAYNKAISECRTIPCSPECRGLWKPGQVLVEGVDYRVVAAFLADGGGVKEYFAFPLPVKSEQSEDDLWYKAIDLIMVAHDKGLSKEDAVGVVKSQYIITKR